MKLLIFTPGLRRSAIGRMARILVQRLVETGHQVTVIRTEATDLMSMETHVFPCPMIPWDQSRAILEAANDADGLIYQIGDNYQFHQGGLEWLQKLPGIVCLHDYFLGSLFWAWSSSMPREDAYAVLRRHYGDGVAGYFDHDSAQSFIEATCTLMPMTEWIASMARGVVVHSHWDIGRVFSACAGPVRVVPLAYDRPQYELGQLCDIDAPESFVVLTVGHANPNKRIRSVIQAIGLSPSVREKALYRLVGYIDPHVAAELSSLAQGLGVRLQILGEVDDRTLACAIFAADVVTCLRHPSLEAASASAIEAMLYAKPIIVTDVGFYSELPDECVVKISIDHELVDLRVAFEDLLDHPESRKMLGRRAGEYASATFSAEQYSVALVGLIDEVQSSDVVEDALARSMNILHRWGAPNDSAYSMIDMERLGVFDVASRKGREIKCSEADFGQRISYAKKGLVPLLFDFVVSRPRLHGVVLSILRSSPRLKRSVRRLVDSTAR